VSAPVAQNLVLVAATGLTALLIGFREFNVTLGLPPFWSDVTVSIAVLCTAISWFRDRWRHLRQPGRIALPPLPPPRAMALVRRLVLAAWPGVLLLAALAWIIRLPVDQLTSSNWTFCGSLTHRCGERPCLTLLDAKGRPIGEQCQPVDDDSGWKRLKMPSQWAYRPARVELTCGGYSVSRPVPHKFLDGSCDGRLDLQ